MRRLARLSRSVGLVASLIVPCAGAAGDGYAVYQAEAPFESVLDGLKAAIGERGFYINNVMDIGGMHERTGKDLGMSDAIYAKAQSVEFCSALLSREMSAENPARIVNCPFIISVYQLAGEPTTTYVAHREIPPAEQSASPAMTKVADMLAGVAEAALEW